MNKTIVTIPGPPIPLKRPRFSNRGKRLGSNAYDSQRDIKEEVFWIINCQIKSASEEVNASPTRLPISIKLTFFMGIPKSYSKKKKLEIIGQPHVKRPDIDNLIKFYLDVCNGATYYDDAQVHTLTATKIYDENPRTTIEITKGKTNEN